MKGRSLKFFLPLVLAFLALVAFSSSKVYADDSNGDGDEGNYGSIRVCKIIVDENSNIVNGATKPGTQFSISGITPAQTSEAAPAGQIGTSTFTAPLTLNANLLGENNDAKCVTYSELQLGSYYYGEETINPSAGWATPKYNDQFTVNVSSINDFFSYDGNLFDGNAANDDSRNKNADGHIVLTSERPNRTLIVLNKIGSTPPTGGGGQGGGPSSGGESSTPACPQTGPQQIDQVWFTDVKPNEVTVHWVNKGDAAGFHIAYGPAQNNLIWGVEVDDHNATQFTLSSLPGGDLWVAVSAKSSKDCGGPTSPVVKVGGPQVLAATGSTSTALLFLAGFSLIALGLWQAQPAHAKRGATKKA